MAKQIKTLLHGEVLTSPCNLGALEYGDRFVNSGGWLCEVGANRSRYGGGVMLVTGWAAVLDSKGYPSRNLARVTWEAESANRPVDRMVGARAGGVL